MSAQASGLPDAPALFTRLDELRQADRRAASAHVASVIGHLIGTPLNVIAGRAALIRSSQTPDAVNENVRRIEDQVERLAQRIRRLLDYLSVVYPPQEACATASVIRDVVSLYGPVAEQKGITLTINCDDETQTRIDERPALLVLTTLLSLALRTTPTGEVVALSLAEHRPDTVVFELTLPGLETPPSRVDKLEPPEPGSGYDSDALQVLSICLGVARRSGGGIEVVPAPMGKGSVVRFESACLSQKFGSP